MFRIILSAYDPAGAALFHNREYMGRSLAEVIAKMQADLAPHSYVEAQPVEMGDRGPGHEVAASAPASGSDEKHGDEHGGKPHDRVNAPDAAREDDTDQIGGD